MSWHVRVGVTVLVLAVLAACAETVGGSPSEAPATASAGQDADGAPVTLEVSNQSFDDPSVELVIVIDGTVVVDQQFAVKDQHNWVTFELSLPAGDHELVATSDSGLEESFTFTTVEGEPRWLVLNYWWYVGEYEGETGFSFDVSDQEFGHF